MWWLTGIALATTMPVVELSWRGDQALLTATGVAGEHVAQDAPFDLQLTWGPHSKGLAGFGADAAQGVPLSDVRGAEMTGKVRLSLCDDGGTTCRMVDAEISGEVPHSRRGRLQLTVLPPAAGVAAAAPTASHGAVHASPYKADAVTTHSRAVKQARDGGQLVLLDFTAVWCPPCNLMSAEVFEAEPRAAVLDAFVIAPVDADDPSSFALKDRYAVGGYPTVVVTDVEGNELSRYVGYLDRETLLAWLERASVAEVADGDRVALSPSAVPAQEAAEIAWLLVGRGETEVGPWLERAAGAPDSVELHMARLAVSPSAADLQWLALHASEQALAWLPAGLPLAAQDEEARSAALLAIQRALPHASGPAAADLLYMAAEVSGGDEAPLLYAAAAAALRASLSGDPVLDRGYYTWLARLSEHGGDVDGGLALLEEAASIFPDEPTFHESRARMLLRADRPEEALQSARSAAEVAWGDNHTRVAKVVFDALVALGRDDEARTVAEQALARAPDPGELAVRSSRYTEALNEGLAKLAAAAP